MTSPSTSLLPLISSILCTVDYLDQDRHRCYAGPPLGSALHEDDTLAGAFPLSDLTFRQLWRAGQLIDSWLLGAVASDDEGDPLVDDLASWAALLKDALDLTTTAAWVLGPIDRRTRVTRRLDLELYTLRELRRAQRLAGLPTASTDDATRLVQQTARAAGLRVQGRFPVRSALDAAGTLCSGGKDLVAIHSLLSLAASGSRDALRSLGLVPILHPAFDDGWEQQATAMDGFTVAMSACVTLLDATYRRHADLRRSPVALADDLRGAV